MAAASLFPEASLKARVMRESFELFEGQRYLFVGQVLSWFSFFSAGIEDRLEGLRIVYYSSPAAGLWSLSRR
jgi:hypothetical protein